MNRVGVVENNALDTLDIESSGRSHDASTETSEGVVRGSTLRRLEMIQVFGFTLFGSMTLVGLCSEDCSSSEYIFGEVIAGLSIAYAGCLACFPCCSDYA